MRLLKRAAALLLAALLCAMSMTAYAHETPDMTREGAISVTMTYGGKAVSGGSLTLYRVGEIREDDGNYSFALTGDFTGSGAALTELSSGLAEELANYAETQKLTGRTEAVGADGKVSFSGLALGLYLLVQEEAAKGYNEAAPFLVSVPVNEDGTYVYEVDASPKVALEKEPEPTDPTAPVKPNLPQTGQLNWPIPVLAATGLALFALGWSLRFLLSRKKKNNEG